MTRPVASLRSGSPLTTAQMERYSRHLILPEVGGKGQRRIMAARVLVIGAGGLGSPAAMYLAAAGVGTLGIVDGDRVDLSNLQRQILHTTAGINRPKAESAKETLEALNPEITVKTYATTIKAENVMDLLAEYDLILDGSDNFPTRYLMNDACYFAKKPLVSGSIFKFEGQLMTIKAYEGTGCYRCLFPEPPPPGLVPNCQEAGVLGVLAGTIGTLQAAEALKEILGAGDSMAGRLLLYDALRLEFKTVKVRKDPACPLCSAHPKITRLLDYEQSCTI